MNTCNIKVIILSFLFFIFLMFLVSCGGGGSNSIVSWYSKNTPPQILNFSINETNEAFLFNVNVFDLESDECYISFFYSTDSINFLQINDILNFKNKLSSNHSETYYWKPLNFNELNFKNLKFKVIVTDTILSSEAIASVNVSIPNVTQYMGKVAFLSTRNTKPQIFIMNLDGTNQYPLTDGSLNENFPAISPDGEKIVFVGIDKLTNNNALYIIDSNGLNLKVLKIFDTNEEIIYPSFSYDNQNITYVLKNGNNYSLCVIDKNGLNNYIVQTFNQQILYPTFVPNENIISFSINNYGKNSVYVYYIDSGNLEEFQKATTYNVNRLSFSSNGEKIIFSSDFDGDFDIYIRDLTNNSIIKLTDNNYNDTYPSFSPDGNNVVFLSNKDGYVQIYLMNLETKELKKLTNTSCNEIYPTIGNGFVFLNKVSSNLKNIVLSNTVFDNLPIDLSKIICTAYYSDGSFKNIIPTWEILVGEGELKNNLFIPNLYSDTDYVILRAKYVEQGVTVTSDLKINLLSFLISKQNKIYVTANLNKSINSLISNNQFEVSEIYLTNYLGSELKQLTFDNVFSKISKITISPDGKKLVFSAIINNNSELFLINLITYEQIRLTNNLSFDGEPCFIDNENLIFTSNRNGNYELYTLNLEDLNVTRLTYTDYDEHYPYAIRSKINDKVFILYSTSYENYEKIYLSVLNDELTKIISTTQVTFGSGNDKNPCFGSGDNIIFESDRDGILRLYMVNLFNLNDVKPLTDLTYNSMYPYCIPNNELLTYVVEKNSMFGIKVLNLNTLEQYSLFEGKDFISKNYFSYPIFTYNKNGIIYVVNNLQILLTPIEGSVNDTIILFNSLVKSGALSISKDNKLYYHSTKNSIGGYFEISSGLFFPNTNIFELNLETNISTKITNVTSPILGLFYPNINPVNSNLLTVTIKYEDDNLDIGILDKTTKNIINLTNSPFLDFNSKFSPDGQKIVFVSDRSGNNDVYIMNSNGDNTINLTNNPADDDDPSFSPDGQKIVFTSNRDGYNQIYIMDTNGKNLERITNLRLNCIEPCFSNEGDKIIFAASTDLLDGGIYVVDIKSKKVKLILRNSIDLMFSNPIW